MWTGVGPAIMAFVILPFRFLEDFFAFPLPESEEGEAAVEELRGGEVAREEEVVVVGDLSRQT